MDNSKAFDEFIYKRCEEIVSNDEECNQLKEDILCIDEKIRNSLNSEQLKIFNDYEGLMINLKSLEGFKLYKKVFPIY